MKFKFKYMTQTQLGKLYGVSSHKIGQWLVAAGLRSTDKRPSCEAHNDGFCTTGPSGTNGYHWVWHSEKTVRALQDNGHFVIADAPPELIEQTVLNGPFHAGKGKEILNGDGSVAITAMNAESTRIVLKLLNMAHRHGVIERMAHAPAEATASSSTF